MERVECIEGEIRQVLNNLISNAVDAMLPGGTLRLRSREATEWRSGRRGVMLTVADDGCGMDGKTLARVFEAFYTTKGAGGTGLGLWISAEILGRHGSRMLVRSSTRVGGAWDGVCGVSAVRGAGASAGGACAGGVGAGTADGSYRALTSPRQMISAGPVRCMGESGVGQSTCWGPPSAWAVRVRAVARRCMAAAVGGAGAGAGALRGAAAAFVDAEGDFGGREDADELDVGAVGEEGAGGDAFAELLPGETVGGEVFVLTRRRGRGRSGGCLR